MRRTPLYTKNSTNHQNKNKSDPAIIKTPLSNAHRKKKNSDVHRTRGESIIQACDKENIINQSKSSSDISEDEGVQMEITTQTHSRKVSPVHQFATKISSQEYHCKICLKVKF